jgi:broad specificity phosphatase PhoE
MNTHFRNQFYIVRHGKAQNNALSIVSCKIETQKEYGLTEEGKEVVNNEAQKYNDFDVIYSSPFRRAEETALFFAKTSNCDVVLDNRLKEFDAGELDLKPYELFHHGMKEHKDPNYIFKSGESLSNALKRLVAFIDEVNSKSENKKILIVSHGIPCELIMDWSKGIDIRKWGKCVKNGKVFTLNS